MKHDAPQADGPIVYSECHAVFVSVAARGWDLGGAGLLYVQHKRHEHEQSKSVILALQRPVRSQAGRICAISPVLETTGSRFETERLM